MSYQWTEDSVSDNLDVEEFEVDGEQKVFYRSHWVVVIWRHELANSFPSQVGHERAVLSYKVGDRTVFKGSIGIDADSPKYICVADGDTPEGGGQTGYVRRRQTWELYDEWILAPDHWQGNDGPGG